ncbi:unnamed protein product [Caenorhabditis sp. 36 PRJEB53466]|nr:unnamed protein product [Caenorhabditis sp. 36 PRJEB53466]
MNRKKCKKCGTKVKWSTAYGTNSLRHHMTQFHRDSIEKLKADDEKNKEKMELAFTAKRKQSILQFPVVQKKEVRAPIVEPPKITSVAQANNRKNEKIDLLIIKMICSDLLPLRITEKTGFSELLKFLAPYYKIRSRFYFSNTALPMLRRRLEDSIKEDLNSMTSLALTSDAWSSKDGKKSLLAVTGHWIETTNFEPKFALLDARPIKGKHTAENFALLIEETLNNYKLSPVMVSCITRDGATSMEAMSRKLSIDSFQCYAHLIQLSIKDSLEKSDDDRFEKAMQKAKKIIRKVNKSSKLREYFEQCLRDENLPERQLLKNVETRWSSLYVMLNSFVINKKGIIRMEFEDSQRTLPEHPELTGIDWEIIEAMRDLLEPVADLVEAIQHRRMAPCSIIIPTVMLLNFRIREMEMTSKTEAVRIFAKNFAESLERRAEKYKSLPMLQSATFCDPRYKDAFSEKNSYRDEIVAILRSSSNQKDRQQGGSPEHTVECSSTYYRFLKEKGRTAPKKTLATDEIEQEVDSYLSTPPDSSTDPFLYWRLDQSHPNLKNMAIRLLAIPATSSESERVFNVSGAIFSPRRMRICSDRLQDLTFCSINTKLY